MNKKICVVGAGSWGKNHIHTLYEMGNLGGIIEINNEKLNEYINQYHVKGYLNLEDSFKDNYDGYVVATPASTHFDIGSSILKAKKNVLIEKPLSLSSKDAKKIIELSINNKCKLMVGYILLFHPAIIKIKELLKKGKIGNLLYVYSTRLNFGTIRTEESICFSFAPHDIYILNYLIEDLPVSINTVGSCLLNKNIHDSIITNFKYKNNIDAHIFVSWLHPYKEQKIILIGDKGMISFDDASNDKKIYLYNRKIDWEKGYPIKKDNGIGIIDYESMSPLKRELEYFISSLDSDVLIADGLSAYNVIKILEKISYMLNEENDNE
jgi:UDP-2-acetamido-3-amino-2,3-dideoxy-glucuronate N-acetyltransferase